MCVLLGDRDGRGGDAPSRALILVLAKIRVLPMAMPDMLREVGHYAQQARNESGCHEYVFLRSPEDEDLIVFVERWADRASLSRHVASEAMADYRRRTARFVVRRELVAFEVVEVGP
jgi:quinol monooxygenase YgiN